MCTLSRSLSFFLDYFVFILFTWWGVQMYTKIFFHGCIQNFTRIFYISYVFLLFYMKTMISLIVSQIRNRVLLASKRFLQKSSACQLRLSFWIIFYTNTKFSMQTLRFLWNVRSCDMISILKHIYLYIYIYMYLIYNQKWEE